MNINNKIGWCDATWNPVTGCSPESEGCLNCWAKRLAETRLRGRVGYDLKEPFDVTFHPNRLDEPLKLKKSSMIFVSSMGDLFHPDVQGQWLLDIWHVMEHSPQHTFLVLTKRPLIARSFLLSREPIKHIWIGVTAENQTRADERIPILLSIPAAKHFVSVEPILDPVNLEPYLLSDYDKAACEIQLLEPLGGFNYRKLKWVIAGPETGPNKRPYKDEWIEDLYKQSEAAGVPFWDKRKQNITERKRP